LEQSPIADLKETTMVSEDRIIRMILLMRSKGASIRVIAKYFGESKSTMGRWVKVLEAAHLGQPGENLPEIATTREVDLSHLGQKGSDAVH
jgi:transposase-like protein